MFSSWSLAQNLAKRSICTFSSPLNIQFTNILCAEPLKKKKRLNPQIIKQREERKRKRIEKQIRRLERNDHQLKMISECEVPIEIIDNPQLYKRNVAQSIDEDTMVHIMKDWSRTKLSQQHKDKFMIERIMESHENALEQLKLESPELYKSAIEGKADFIPWKTIGPVETPPIQDYDSPDGEFIDISKKWDHK